MLVNVGVVFRNLKGEVLKDVDADGKTVDATLKDAIVNAVLSPGQDETGKQKVECYEIARRVFAGGNVELSAEDIVLIKNKVGKVYPPLIVGQAYALLEGKAEKG